MSEASPSPSPYAHAHAHAHPPLRLTHRTIMLHPSWLILHANHIYSRRCEGMSQRSLLSLVLLLIALDSVFLLPILASPPTSPGKPSALA